MPSTNEGDVEHSCVNRSNIQSKQAEKSVLLNSNEKHSYFGSISGNENNSKDLNDLTAVTTDKTKCEKFCIFVKTLTVEPLMFLAMFSFVARAVCFTNLTMDKFCQNSMNYSVEICSNLSSNITIKEEVEKFSNTFGLYSNLISFGPSALMMIFIGPWSDRYGRKIPLLLSIIGLLVDDIGITLNTIYFEAPVEYLLSCSVASGITGGFIGLMTLLYSISSEMTTTRMRTLKYGLIELSFGMGMSLGMLAGGLLYKSAYSYFAAFGVCILGHALCIPWIVFVIRETRGLDIRVSLWTKLKDLFTFETMTEGWKACVKVRENYGRCQIWLLFSSMCTIIITYESFAHISYLYAFHIYGWGPTKYSEVNTFFSIITIIISVACIPLFIRICKCGDPALGLVGTLSMMSKNVFLAVAEYHKWIYYVGNSFGALSGLSTLAIRSRLSKIVDKEDLGKVFAFLSTCESLVPLLGNIIISRLYNLTLDTFPGACFLFGAAVLILPVITFLWIIRLRPSAYQQMKSGQIQEA